MAAGIFDPKIDQGSTFILNISVLKPNGLPFNLTGYSARSKVRLNFYDTSPVATPIIGFNPDRTTGKLSLTIPDTVTAQFDFYRAFYDVELISGSGVVSRIVQGTLKLNREVTK